MSINISSSNHCHVYPIKIPDIIPYLSGKNLELYLTIKELHKVKLLNKELNNNIYLDTELCVKKSIITNYLRVWRKMSKLYSYFNNTFFPQKLINLFPILSIIKYETKHKKKWYNGHITVFQRYTGNKKGWVKCNTKGPLMSGDGSTLFNEKDKTLFIGNIIRLLVGKKIIVNEYNYINGETKQVLIDCQLYNN